MRKNFKKIFIYIICTIIFMVSFTGCSIVENDEEKTIKDKTNEEIKYLEDEILTIVNKYAKGEYYIENTNQENINNVEEDNMQNASQVMLNWDEINKTTNKINETLDTILLDLSEIEISNDDLINFRNQVNNLSIAVANQDETVLLQECSILYSLLPTYLEKYSNDKNKVDIMQLKSLVLSSFIYANLQDWENAKSTIDMAETKYKQMMDNIEYMKEYSYNLNKVYILVEEIKSSINQQQLDLSKIKYINFIEKI